MSDVAIIMGSDSDWPVMEEAAKALDSFGITYTADVVSAHRMLKICCVTKFIARDVIESSLIVRP